MRDVTFSVPSQAFQGQLEVTMTTTAVGVEIRYTTDRTLPTASSQLYSGGPLTISSTTQLRAQTFAGGVPSGAVTTALYIARDFDATSDIPLVIVDGYGQGQPTDQEVWVDAAIMTFEPAGGEAKLSALPTLANRIAYHVRGESSSRFPQKSYRIELRDDADRDVDHPVLGMPAESDWALVAPYYDRALLRNPFIYSLGSDMGLEAPRVRYAEVYINYENRPVTSSDYAGIYFVTETVKNATNRLNLSQLRPQDTLLPAISGGYIIKFEVGVAQPPTITCTGSRPLSGSGGGTCFSDLELVDPDPPTPEQQGWVTGYIQQFHDSLHTTPMGDYASAIDLPSFVDYFIVNELSRNLDEFTRSAYFHKDRDGKLTAGPLWDYNFSMDCGRASNRPPEGWQYGLRRTGNDWFPMLVTDPAFMAAVVTRWQELRQGLLSTAGIEQRIAAVSAPLANAVERDFARWPVSVVYASGQTFLGPTAATWGGQVQAIRDWLLKRMAWMDTQLR
jgi:hypothetical protein